MYRVDPPACRRQRTLSASTCTSVYYGSSLWGSGAIILEMISAAA